MSCNRLNSVCLLVLRVLCFSSYLRPEPVPARSPNPREMQPGQQERHGEHEPHQHHHLHLALGGEKCEPKFTYEEGPLGPSHWAGLCNSGKMQAPIDIQHAEKLRIYDLKFNYQPADLDIVNDCNQYRILVKFPDNYWLKVGKKPYFLSGNSFSRTGRECRQW